MIQSFSHNNKQIALVVRNDYVSDGAKFFTDENSPQQVGIIKYKKNHKIPSHIHNNKKREIYTTSETIIVRKGKLKLDLYSNDKKLIESTILNQGDIAILISGGHGFLCMEDCEIIEIKQGPYLFEQDKIMINEDNNA